MSAETPERPDGEPISLSRLAHDLLQPLRAIVLNVQLLQRREGALTAEAKSGLETVLAAARVQEDLIASLVEYDNALYDGWTGNETGPLSLAVQTACLKLEAYCEQRKGSIDVAAPLPAARVHPSLAKVLERVIHNALKFNTGATPPVVKIEAWEEEGGSIAIRVADNGLGVEREYRNAVFQPFSRLHGSGQFPGAGMGLAICRRLLHRLGGAISFEDPADSTGAVVWIRFPAMRGD